MLHTPSHDGPLVSVVMATYNRSNILRYAIETVRRQTLPDWELLVVGDGCTDDTDAVVAACGDERIRFWNVDRPGGEQSGPNNAGVSRARGRYIAYLNHDDFWTAKHLARTVDACERDPSVDLVFGLNISIYPDGQRIVWGATEGDQLPAAGVPASSWVMRRSLVDRVGPWGFSRDLYLVPSQDWLQRARATGARLKMLPMLSTISFPSSSRAHSYSERPSQEHADWFKRLEHEPDFAEDLLCAALVDRDLTSTRSGNSLAVAPFVRRALLNAGKRALAAVGVSPLAAALWWRHGRRGGFIAHARRVRGLPPNDLQSMKGEKRNA